MILATCIVGVMEECCTTDFIGIFGYLNLHVQWLMDCVILLTLLHLRRN